MPKADTLPTRFGTPAVSSSTVIEAHIHLIERLESNLPSRIGPPYRADADDFNQRAEHLRRLMIAITDYIGVAIADIADVSHEIDRKYVLGCLDDLTGEIVGSLTIAADDMQRAA